MQSTTEQISQAHAIGQYIARQQQTLFTITQDGTMQAAAKGARDQSGLAVGFSHAGNGDQHQRVFKLPTDGYDHLIYTNSTSPKRLERFLMSLDALIVIALPQASKFYGSQFPPNMPLAILTQIDTPTSHIQPLLDITRATDNPVIYNQNPRELVQDLVRLAKQLKNAG